MVPRAPMPLAATAVIRVLVRAVFLLVATAATGPGHAATGAPAAGAASTPAATPAQLAALFEPALRLRWTGDLPALRQRGWVRILVPHNRTHYQVDRGAEHGIVVELGRAFEQQLNASVRRPEDRVRVVFVPVPRDQLLAGLAAGRGDLAAGSLTVTDARAHRVDFGTPFLRGVREVLVSGPSAPALGTGSDALAGQVVTVRRSSSYHEHLVALNAALAARGRPPVTLKAADERLEDEALLELVSAGVLPWAVVDDFAAALWVRVLPNLRVHEDIVIHADGQVAWAMRPGSPALAAEVDRFVRRYARGTLLGNVVLNRYLADTRFVTNPGSPRDQARFAALLAEFTRFGAAYDLDPLMLVAQGYQESGLDQARRSPRGAVGVMQLLPATAAAPPIGIRGIDRDPARNIEAAAKYLDYLRRTYVDEPGISDADRLLLTFAAYNAGPGNLRRFRQAAVQRGLDPNVWFGNVEVGAARIVGRETVDYVANIVKYYVAYRLAVERSAEQAAARTLAPPPRR